MTESEGKAIRFTIDHYEPEHSRPDLVNDYSNLMYSCDTCNSFKTDWDPPAEARADGHKFFRPDEELRGTHFEGTGRHITGKTTTGTFTIQVLDLNRHALKVIRDLRRRLVETDKYVVEGIMALRGYPLDSLPPEIRHKTRESVNEAMATAEELVEEIDALLREYAGSPLVDPDDEKTERAITRAKSMKEYAGMYPGKVWRAPRAPRKKKK
ncbi:MAG: hypothetical protein KIT13_06380 [Burkholderiales bacterium]|nr:hypothetical protein [Burkholderiales bacterium]